MIVESVKLDQFRNYKSLELEFDSGTNLFYGDNAQGKTNVLEAVYLCGTTRSHRAGKDREMIRFGQEEAHICMRIRKGDVPYRIDMHLKKNRSKGIAINGPPVRKASELVGLGNFVFFSSRTDRRSGGGSLIWSCVSWTAFIYISCQIIISFWCSATGF